MTNSTTTSATSATGALIHILATTLLLLIYPISSWCSEDSKPPQIEREIINKSLPTAEIAHQRIFVSFEGSPKMTRILQEKLKAKGFAVVDDPSLAEAKFKFNGHYIISALAKQNIVGPLSEILEQTIKLDEKSPAPTIRRSTSCRLVR